MVVSHQQLPEFRLDWMEMNPGRFPRYENGIWIFRIVLIKSLNLRYRNYPGLLRNGLARNCHPPMFWPPLNYSGFGVEDPRSEVIKWDILLRPPGINGLV